MIIDGIRRSRHTPSLSHNMDPNEIEALQKTVQPHHAVKEQQPARGRPSGCPVPATGLEEVTVHPAWVLSTSYGESHGDRGKFSRLVDKALALFHKRKPQSESSQLRTSMSFRIRHAESEASEQSLELLEVMQMCVRQSLGDDPVLLSPSSILRSGDFAQTSKVQYYYFRVFFTNRRAYAEAELNHLFLTRCLFRPHSTFVSM